MRAVLRVYANNDSSNFKAMKVRFVKPVIPGQTLKVDMWKNGKRIFFKTSVVETGVEVITGKYFANNLKTFICLLFVNCLALQIDLVNSLI